MTDKSPSLVKLDVSGTNLTANNPGLLCLSMQQKSSINLVTQLRTPLVGAQRYWYQQTKKNNPNEVVYLSLLADLLTKAKKKGVAREDRTKVGTYSEFGTQTVYDLRQGFPLLTTKKINLDKVLHELIWFLSGSTNNAFLKQRNVGIWDEWAHPETGELGPIYGNMWRHWEGRGGQEYDQIRDLFLSLYSNPTSRRHVVSGWNPSLLPVEGNSHKENVEAGLQALPPCHTLWQVYLEPLSDSERWAIYRDSLRLEGKDAPKKISSPESLSRELARQQVPKYYLDLKLYQRSADIFLGVPFNIASYAALMLILSLWVEAIPRRFIHTFGDVHLYSNHVDQAEEQLGRSPNSTAILHITEPEKYSTSESATSESVADEYINHFLTDTNLANWWLQGYDPQPFIKAPVAV